jgi:hypothetical protein
VEEEMSEPHVGNGRYGWNAETRDFVLTAIANVRREMLLLNEERDKRYTERARAQDTAVATALSTSGEAINKAEKNTREWQVSANEWRGSMNDREAKFLAKEEAALMVGALNERVRKLESLTNMTQGRSQGMSALGIAVYFAASGLMSIAAVLISIIHH